MNVLVVVDMQNDFIDGALGTAEAPLIVPAVARKIENFKGLVLFTRDTHVKEYLDTQEGKSLPVIHCVKDTPGWEIRAELDALRTEDAIDKPTFGSTALGELLKARDEDLKKRGQTGIESVTLIGLCTDICVISNALLVKAFLPEVPIIVDASCCAGVTPQSHETALEAMKMCQIQIVGE
jgi:nicotinamidase-related amidase